MPVRSFWNPITTSSFSCERAHTGQPAVAAAAATVAPRRKRRLRRENRTLRMERDILKQATAFFAKENA